MPFAGLLSRQLLSWFPLRPSDRRPRPIIAPWPQSRRATYATLEQLFGTVQPSVMVPTLAVAIRPIIREAQAGEAASS